LGVENDEGYYGPADDGSETFSCAHACRCRIQSLELSDFFIVEFLR